MVEIRREKWFDVSMKSFKIGITYPKSPSKIHSSIQVQRPLPKLFLEMYICSKNIKLFFKFKNTYDKF